VIGAGPIGSMFVRLAKLRGAQVIAIGRRRSKTGTRYAPGRRPRGRHRRDVSNPVAAVRELTGGRGADIVIEAVGKPETWNWSVEMLRRGGTVNFFGGPPSGTRVELDTNLLHYSEITCKASFHHTPAAMREALDIIESGGVTARDFVEAEEPLENLSKVLFRLAWKAAAL
jgi:L-iditol 2-dehydrogenase